MFIPTGDDIYKRSFPVLAASLVLVNILVFCHQLTIFQTGHMPTIMDFLNTWGMVPAELAKGRVLGLLTHMFMHGSILHITGNMFMLWALCGTLEIALGRATLLGFYLMFGIAGALTQAMCDWTSTQPMIGASGAVAGLLGAYTVLYGITSKIHGWLFLGVAAVRVALPTIVFGGGWLALQLYAAHLDPEGKGEVAVYAHIGGFMAGVLIMSVCLYDTNFQVQRSSTGVLSFNEHSDRAARRKEASLAAEQSVVATPRNCPSCDRALSEQDKIADNYARCGNPDCGRIVCLEDCEPAMA